MDQMIDLEMDQSQGYFHPEPCLVMGAPPNFSQPNIHTVVRALGNTANIDSHNAMMYRVTQYSGIPNQHNLELSVASPANLYYSGMPPSSTGVLPIPMPQRVSDQTAASSTYAVTGVPADSLGRSGHFIDDVRGPCKRKYAEGMSGNALHFNASAGSSSSVAPPNTGHPDGVVVVDAISYALPQYGGNRSSGLMEVGHQSGVWRRSGDSILVHDHNHMIQGHYMAQSFQAAATPWMDQQLCSNNNDVRTSGWNQPQGMPYVQASNVNGTLETGPMGVQRYHETANERGGGRFMHPHLINPRHHNYHHPAMPMQGVRGHNINIHHQVPASSHRVRTNPSRNSMAPPQNGFEMGTRHLGPVPPTGLRIFNPPRGGVIPETTLGHHNLPQLRILRDDEVAILEMQPDLYEVGNIIDHHRDMRLDIEGMSYEELLALEERMGSVSTGLSEETIMHNLKTKTYITSAPDINLEEAAPEDQETDSCIVCQEEYKKQEKIGVLECGHDYHVDCLKKWLLVKNVCPICKSEAISSGKKHV